MLPALRRSRGVREAPVDPFRRDIDSLFPDISRWFGGFAWPETLSEDGLTAQYPVDIVEDDDKILVDAEIPGFKKDEIEISAENGLLRISAERKSEERKGKKHLQERRFHRVERCFTLPASVDDSKAVATFEDGVLHLELPKTAESKSHRIKVS